MGMRLENRNGIETLNSGAVCQVFEQHEHIQLSLVVFGYAYRGELPGLDEIYAGIDEMLDYGWTCKGIHNNDGRGAIYAWFERNR